MLKHNRNFKKEERISKKPVHEVAWMFPGTTCYIKRLVLTGEPAIKSPVQNSLMLIPVSLGYKGHLKGQKFKVKSETKTNPTIHVISLRQSGTSCDHASESPTYKHTLSRYKYKDGCKVHIYGIDNVSVQPLRQQRYTYNTQVQTIRIK